MKLLDGPPSLVHDHVRPRVNDVLAGILIILLQIAVGLLYGFLMYPQTTVFTGNGHTLLLGVLATVSLALFIIIGFGGMFAYLRGLAWSSIGFTLLIVALSVEQFLLVNALWGWANMQISQDRPAFSKTKDQYLILLSLGTHGSNIQGNMISQGFKCALANVVGFSAILGRGGPLQAFILSFCGTIGYELLRVVMTDYTFDGPGTFTIFIYGGFLGLVASIFLAMRQKCSGTTADHPLYTSHHLSATIALIGTVFTWLFFPALLNDSTWNGASFIGYTGMISIYYSLCASTIAAFVWSSAINGKLIVRDIIYGPIAGGVIGATASLYVVNPVYAMIMGFTGGTVQVIGQNVIEKNWIRAKMPVLNSVSFLLFGVQGLLGSAFASAWNAIIHTDNETFVYNATSSTLIQGLSKSYWPFLMGLMSISFAVVAGLFVGVFFLLTASHAPENHFNDYTYWVQDDGINYGIDQPAEPIQPVPTPVEDKEVHGKWVSGSNLVKSQHAYL